MVSSYPYLHILNGIMIADGLTTTSIIVSTMV